MPSLRVTTLVVVAFGLYQVFLRPNLPMPPWLKIDNRDQLSETLIEVAELLQRDTEQENMTK